METERHSKVVGIGAYLPDQIIKSNELMDQIHPERFGIPSNFIESRIGILERRISGSKIRPSELAIRAGSIALSNAGIDAQDIDVLIFCGIERDWLEPATAHRVQDALGASSAICFDVSNACNGFMSGLYLADCMIAAGRVETALVVTGEKPSKVMYEIMDLIRDCDDAEYFRKKVGVLTVGDSGGSMVLAKSDNGVGFQKFNSISDGKLAELCYYRYDEKGIVDGQMIMKEIGREVFNYQSRMIDVTYEKLGWTPDDVDYLISHQIGRKPFEMTAKLTGIPIEKATKTYDFYGNLTSATIPVNLYLNPPKSGDKLLLMGTGSGLSVIQAGLTF